MDRIRADIIKAFSIDPHLLAADPMPTRNEIVLRMAQDKARRDERTILRMLGQWVSELDPSVCIDRESGEVIGLCMAGDPTGHIVIAAGVDTRQMMRHVMSMMGVDAGPLEIMRPGHYAGNDF